MYDLKENNSGSACFRTDVRLDPGGGADCNLPDCMLAQASVAEVRSSCRIPAEGGSL